MATVRISRCLFLQLCIIIVVYTIVASEACFAANERLDFSGLLSEICKTKSSTHLLLAAGHVGDVARYTAGGGRRTTVCLQENVQKHETAREYEKWKIAERGKTVGVIEV